MNFTLDPSQGNGSDDSDATFNIKLHKSEKLFDDSFVFITRDENRTTLVNDFDKLAEKYSNCFYRNENSAIDLCDGNMVRGAKILEFLQKILLDSWILFFPALKHPARYFAP